ncbi:MAG: D-cysteine desulfhydrase family protein [Erysipelotrichaceae bacterium]|nr:D-cysteine desulfhydrase family protein [Erysipelotrichaceae bacterium]
MNISKLNLAHLPTPIEKLDKTYNNKNIYIKRDDLTESIASGNKIRKLEYELKYALDQGTDLIITCGGYQSNHCRATAALCSKLHLKCVLLLRKELGDNLYNGNYFLDDILGASIYVKEHDDFQENKQKYLEELKHHYTKAGYHPYIIPMGASDGIGTLGYVNAYEEILQNEKELQVSFDTIVCAVGSGGTYAGLYIGNELFHQNKKIIGINVCDDAQFFVDEIRKIIHDTLDFIGQPPINEEHITIIDGYVGKGYAQNTKDELVQLMKIAKEDGLVLDPVYTGKAYIGMIKEIVKGTFKDSKNILFIHTGGTYGLLAKANEFILQS